MLSSLAHKCGFMQPFASILYCKCIAIAVSSTNQERKNTSRGNAKGDQHGFRPNQNVLLWLTKGAMLNLPMIFKQAEKKTFF